MQLCEALLGRDIRPRELFHLRSLGVVEPWPLGPLPGARADLRTHGRYLHVGTSDRQDGTAEAYVLELHAEGSLDQRDVSLCEALARSVRLAR